MIEKPVLDLTVEAFEPFGKLVNSRCNDSSIAPGFISSLAIFDLGGTTECEIARSVVTPLKFLENMERHFRTQEVFVASQGDFILAITPPSDPQDKQLQPYADKASLFLVRQGQAVVMKRNVWHATVGGSKTATILIFFVKHAYPEDWEMKPFAHNETIEMKKPTNKYEVLKNSCGFNGGVDENNNLIDF